MRNSCKALARKPEGNIPVRRPKRRWIKYRQVVRNGLSYQDRIHWRYFCEYGNELPDPIKGMILFIN
jgi:hypothetical protein